MDKIYMNGHKCEGFDQQADWYQKPFNDCLHLIAEKGLMVEVNTKNLVKKQEVYPHTDYLHRLRELDIPRMANSDCQQSRPGERRTCGSIRTAEKGRVQIHPRTDRRTVAGCGDLTHALCNAIVIRISFHRNTEIRPLQK